MAKNISRLLELEARGWGFYRVIEFCLCAFSAVTVRNTASSVTRVLVKVFDKCFLLKVIT